ncbi:MAG: VOC family protein [Gammaproteobacteria bacterium]|nr:VOC family protein [Gammaproteobacteria bacterium]
MIELGHVVFYVRDLQQSLRFYHDMLQLQLKGRIFNNRAAVLTGGRSHHELLLIETDASEGPLTGRRIGLYHVGWKIGNDLAELRAMQQRILEHGYRIDGQSDHGISQSLYLRDPDGNEVELFVDDPEIDWHQDDSWMQAPVKPLKL